jgi:hypothetical protein
VVVYAVQTIDRRGSKLQIFGLPNKASSRDPSLSVIIGSLLAHCQNRLSAWIIGPPHRAHSSWTTVCLREQHLSAWRDDTPGPVCC